MTTVRDKTTAGTTPKAQQKTRAAHNTYDGLSRQELYDLAPTASPIDKAENNWKDATTNSLCDGLHAKGRFLTDHSRDTIPGLAQLSMALLRIAVSLDGKSAPQAWAVRAVARLLETREYDEATATAMNTRKILALLVSETDDDEEGGTTAQRTREAAEVLTRTVDEQRDELARVVERVKEGLETVLSRTDQFDPQPTQATTTTTTATYATAAATSTLSNNNSNPMPRPKTRSQIEALARARERECRIRIENATISGLEAKEVLAKASLAAERTAELEGVTLPTNVKFIAAKQVDNNTTILMMSTPEGARWIKSRIETVIEGLGANAQYRPQLHRVVAEFVPKTFDPDNQAHLRKYEDDNNIVAGTLQSARFLKPKERHAPTQRVAHVVLAFGELEPANRFLAHGAYIEGKRVRGRKYLPDPLRCLRCQKFGHVVANCNNETDVCARCGKEHRTSMCDAAEIERACANCARGNDQDFVGHGAADRHCPAFQKALAALLGRSPDAKYTYFPDPADVSTWIEEGKEAVDDAGGEPEWQTVTRLRSQRAGPSWSVAEHIQRTMSGPKRPATGANTTQLRQTSLRETFTAAPHASPARTSSDMVLGTPTSSQAAAQTPDANL
uniref:CCHC-type domain-containing protein n=1 Tax=Mycena chlorophos TaxID=658473 RepID=A0ABQ0LBV0_MYCCL|nr:predicted protein [Mycena chlorophos]